MSGKYRVTGLIGTGGMGAVYEAEHTEIGRLIAIKVLHPEHATRKEAIARLEHEARTAGTIGHPNICEVYDMGRLEDGSPYLVMERLRGETLAERLTREGCVEHRDVLDIVIQVVSALVAAHDSGVIHRDLKPDNIFLSEHAGLRPVAKLFDFGVAKRWNSDAMDLTRSGMVMGTPYYMAPEQARGCRDLDGRVDLWAVGVILYEAMGGRRPFVARNYNALLMQILTAKHKGLSKIARGVPPALSVIVDRALAKSRDDRFVSAGELLEALVEVRRSLGASSPAGARAGADGLDAGSGRKAGRARGGSGRRGSRRPAAPGVPAASIAVPPAPKVADPKEISESLPAGDDSTFVLSDRPAEELGHDEGPTVVSPGAEEDHERTVVDPPSFGASEGAAETWPPRRE